MFLKWTPTATAKPRSSWPVNLIYLRSHRFGFLLDLGTSEFSRGLYAKGGW